MGMIDNTTGLPIMQGSPTSTPDGDGGSITPSFSDVGGAVTSPSIHSMGAPPADSVLYGDSLEAQAAQVIGENPGSLLYGEDPASQPAQQQIPQQQYSPPPQAQAPIPQEFVMRQMALENYAKQLEEQINVIDPLVQVYKASPEVREQIHAILSGQTPSQSGQTAPEDGSPPPSTGASFSPELLKLRQELNQVQTHIASVNLEKKIGEMSQRYGPAFNPRMAISYALANNIPDVEVAYTRLLGEQAAHYIREQAPQWAQQNPALYNNVQQAPAPRQMPVAPPPANAPIYARVEAPRARSMAAPPQQNVQRADNYGAAAEQAISLLGGG